MAYDRELADRLRAELAADPRVTEQAMFGGLAFLVDGAMVVAVSGRGGLMVRCDPARATELVAADGVDRMVMRGRELDGWLLVDPGVLDDDAALRSWVAVGQAATAGVRDD
ncbi:TfoX/Sxy family protein [Modestobacter sp. SSW1-42]|uniref:TfoX/Sxy family protein n=1 Tax=Modestobacter sp. SSW1-42 TaxID=596372 RepID=UPI0039875B80